MSKRLQVLFEDKELRHIHAVAKRNGLPVSEWVRQVLREAAGRPPVASAEEKLAAVREAIKYEFPAPDIEVMLAEIEQGYTQSNE